MIGEVVSLAYDSTKDWILNYHYAARMPQIQHAFGWRINGIIEAVCTFGIPASRSLQEGVCGPALADKVIELNRLVTKRKVDNLSCFVGACLRKLKPYDLIVVSYSDLAMGHTGKIYQACNFLYTGLSAYRTDSYTPGGKHSRHSDREAHSELRILRSRKHRYIFFCSHNKKLLKQYREALNYEILPYPEGNTKRYEKGFVLKPVIVETVGDEKRVLTKEELQQIELDDKRKSLYIDGQLTLFGGDDETQSA